MSERSRLATPATVRDFIAAELAAARTAAEPWTHLERAHVVSQPWAWPHTRVHAAMLSVALRRRDRREAVGQIVRLVVAGPGSLVGRYPAGNTGRSSMALTATAPVPADLQRVLEPASEPVREGAGE